MDFNSVSGFVYTERIHQYLALKCLDELKESRMHFKKNLFPIINNRKQGKQAFADN